MKIEKIINETVKKHIQEPVIIWFPEDEDPSSDIKSINRTLFVLTGKDRMELFLDLFRLWMDPKRVREVKRVFGDFHARYSSAYLKYTENNFGGGLLGLGVKPLFWIHCERMISEKEFKNLVPYRLGIQNIAPPGFKWVDESRFSDARQLDDVEFRLQKV